MVREEFIEMTALGFGPEQNNRILMDKGENRGSRGTAQINAQRQQSEKQGVAMRD